MKSILAMVVLFSSLNAFAGAAVCGKYNARVAKTNERVVITTEKSIADDVGYTYIVTRAEGAKGLIVECEMFFKGESDSQLCDLVEVKNLKKVDTEDCFNNLRM